MKAQINPEVAIFNDALELAPTERSAYLDRACAGNIPLREKVEALLKANEQAENFLEVPPTGLPLTRTVRIPITEKPGDKIDRYKLLQQIGEGGCGVVYMAEQEEPVRRRVALKVIKLGMDTKEVIARFEAERQALAMMDHPNIAKVLDAGATDTGRPYFVMELVRGIKITEFCDENKVPTEERLKLFIQVCQAIQHAHQKGIIHRDIKPSNILVTINDGVPVPKVIDFGIAKATQGRLTDKTLFTAFEQFIGTPAYMSPEQALMTSLDIDTRSDIYSLGVLLYELLTGETPFDATELLQSGFDAMRQMIREKEPQRPSARLSTMTADALTTTASQRHTHPPKLLHMISGDLDWIVMTCLEKDRSRRYETANGLAADIQRHLNTEPIVAHPPNGLYRLQKAVRRHKSVFAAVAAIAAALVIGIVVSTLEAIRATRAEREQTRLRTVAETKEKKSEQVAQFLKDMLKGVSPHVALGRDTTMLREIVDKTAERIGTDLKDQPEVRIELSLVLARVYGDLSLFEKEEQIARETLQLARAHYGENNLAVADALSILGRALNFVRKLPEGETVTREAIALDRKLRGINSLEEASALLTLCDLLRNQWDGYEHSKLDEAETAIRRSLAIRKKLLGNDAVEIAQSLDTLSLLLRVENKLAEAEIASRESLAIRKKLYGEDNPTIASSLTWLGGVLSAQGKLKEAEESLRLALAIDVREKSTNIWHHAIRLSYLESVLEKEGNLAEAETCLREAAEVVRLRKNTEDMERYEFIRRLAVVLLKNGKRDDALAAYREVVQGYRGVAGRKDVNVLNSIAWLLATCPLQEIRDGHDAVKYGEQNVDATHRQNPFFLDTLAAGYAECGEFAKAIETEKEAMALRANEAFKKDFSSRLKLYEVNNPYRDRY